MPGGVSFTGEERPATTGVAARRASCPGTGARPLSSLHEEVAGAQKTPQLPGIPGGISIYVGLLPIPASRWYR